MYRVIDKNGLFIRDDFTFDELTEIGLEVEASQGLYQPKWDGEKWIEGGTPPPPAPYQPTQLEIMEANIDYLAIMSGIEL